MEKPTLIVVFDVTFLIGNFVSNNGNERRLPSTFQRASGKNDDNDDDGNGEKTFVVPSYVTSMINQVRICKRFA